MLVTTYRVSTVLVMFCGYRSISFGHTTCRSQNKFVPISSTAIPFWAGYGFEVGTAARISDGTSEMTA
jgi:hypothetical protein